jgi:hypothetical protein
LGVGIGFSMQMKMLNISKTVRDRNKIPSATPTKSWIADSTQLTKKNIFDPSVQKVGHICITKAHYA